MAERQTLLYRQPISIVTDRNFSAKCAELYNKSASDVSINEAINVNDHRYLFSKEHWVNMGADWGLNCDDYFSYHGYYNKRGPINLFEQLFPLAFGILIYHEVDQFEQLFRAIYRPHNYYCVHVDDSAMKQFKAMVI